MTRLYLLEEKKKMLIFPIQFFNNKLRKIVVHLRNLVLKNYIAKCAELEVP